MRMRSFFRHIGTGLLVTVILFSIIKVLLTKRQEADTSRTTVRVAHWQLESGLREALDAVIDEYEKLHPNVRVEQVPIPERMGKNWTRTQLVGRTAPAIIEIGGTMGINDEILARYFLPISDEVALPNPYNEGTSLEGIPWRDTFLDSLTGSDSYSEALLEYYGVGGTIFTIRIYYNKELLKRITGSDAIPKTFDDFVALCERVMEFNAEEEAEGRPAGILPIAGSQYNAPLMLHTLFAAMTQKYTQEFLTGSSLGVSGEARLSAYLDGDWDWTSPPVVKGLEMMREIGRFMQPGFLQLGRDDAMFYFAQGRALMISTGSFDVTSIRVQSPFDVGVFPMPIPTSDHPEYREFVMGPFAEASTGSGFVLGLIKDAPDVDVAMDFLKFLSSKRGNEILSRTSGWPPGVIDIELSKEMKPFVPRMTGYPRGLEARVGAFTDSSRIYNNNFHLLVSPSGSVQDFIDAVQPAYGSAVLSDVRAREREVQRNVSLRDTVLAGVRFLSSDDAEDQDLRGSQISEGQNQHEIARALLNYSAEKYLSKEN